MIPPRSTKAKSTKSKVAKPAPHNPTADSSRGETNLEESSEKKSPETGKKKRTFGFAIFYSQLATEFVSLDTLFPNEDLVSKNYGVESEFQFPIANVSSLKILLPLKLKVGLSKVKSAPGSANDIDDTRGISTQLLSGAHTEWSFGPALSMQLHTEIGMRHLLFAKFTDADTGELSGSISPAFKIQFPIGLRFLFFQNQSLYLDAGFSDLLQLGKFSNLNFSIGSQF